MMLLNFLYNLSINAYVLIIKALAPFNKKAKLWVEGRKNWETQLSIINYQLSEKSRIPHLTSHISHLTSNLAWFHCASLGEFEQGRPVIEAFRKAFPAHKILLTFFSPSGYEVRKNYAGADYIFYLPADTPQNAKKFIEIIQPTIAFFVKYEFWRNYLSELEKHQISAISFSAIFRPNQVFFKSYGSFYRQVLFQFQHIFVQNEESVKLLQSIDYQEVTKAGDTRFDRVKEIADSFVSRQPSVDSIFEKFKNKEQILIVGSAWDADMQVLIPLIRSSTLKFIIAPHEIHSDEIESWRKQIQLKSIRFSEINDTIEIADYQVLIIDNVGMLSSLYQYAEYAYIGGSFGKGLHNILEAATFGMPLFFGNKSYQKFQEAQDLVQMGGAFPVASSDDISLIINDLRSDNLKREKISNICKNYVLENIGATEKIINFVKGVLHQKQIAS